MAIPCQTICLQSHGCVDQSEREIVKKKKKKKRYRNVTTNFLVALTLNFHVPLKSINCRFKDACG
jgi:hypothetical protein